MKINQSVLGALVLGLSAAMMPVCQAAHTTHFVKNHRRGHQTVVHHHAGEVVLLNKATIRDLVQLPGVGRVMAARMVTYRLRHGAYTSVDQLLSIKGMSKHRLAKFRKRLRLK